MRKYEAFYIVSAQLPETDVQKIADKYKAVVEKQGGKVNSAGKWDTRKLEFEIKGHKEGTYILMEFESEPAVQHELKRQMSISDDILRNRIFLMEG